MPFEIRVLAAVLAVALQIQATLPVGSGLRLAVSDLFLPISLVYVGLWRLSPQCRFRWNMPGVSWWLLGITVALTIALLIGHERFDNWSSWALVNKWGGWFALLAYFLIGTAIVRAGGADLRAEFLQTFLVTAVAIALVNAVAMPWLLLHYTLPFGIEFNRATGGMQNANAFGFVVTVAALLVLASGERTKLFLPPLLVALWFTSSRGALLAFAVGASLCLLLAPRRLLPALGASAIALVAIAIVTAASIAVDPIRLAQAESGYAPIGFLSIERLDPEAATIKERQEQNGRAISLFVQAPVFGHGLGYFIEAEESTLHNSLLWIVLETGLVGALAVTGFLLMAVRYLYLGRDDPFLLGMVAVSSAFMVMSVTGEFLYQRHLWLLLGMALATVPAREAR